MVDASKIQDAKKRYKDHIYKKAKNKQRSAHVFRC